MIDNGAMAIVRVLCGKTAARRLHIAQAIRDGRKPKTQHVIRTYGVSRATANRDLRAARLAVEELGWNEELRGGHD